MGHRPRLLRLAFTLILVGYLLEWLPHDSAGLSIMGQELGEWVKFVPKVRGGEIFPGRNFFFLPPWTLALMLVAWTIHWPGRSVGAWSVRAMAILITMLIIPPVEVIRFEGTEQWLPRILMISSVIAVALLIPLLNRAPVEERVRVVSITLVVLGAVGGFMPTWAFVAVRDPVRDLFGAQVGVGGGIWMNMIGHGLIFVIGLRQYIRFDCLRPRPK